MWNERRKEGTVVINQNLKIFLTSVIMCFQWCLPTWNIFKMAHCIRCLSDLTWLPHVPTQPNHQDAAVKNKSFLVAQWVQVSDSIRDSTTCLSQKFRLGPQVKMNAMGSLSTGGAYQNTSMCPRTEYRLTARPWGPRDTQEPWFQPQKDRPS